MFRCSSLTRRLPPRLRTATLMSITRSTIGPRPQSSFPAMGYGERTVLTGSAPKLLGDIFTQKRNLHTDPEDTQSEATPSRMEYRESRYSNKRGEEIVFAPRDPPPGYVFVTTGNVYITRHCRKLAQKLYVVYRYRSIRKGGSTPIGLFVTAEVFEEVVSDYKAKKAEAKASVGRVLDREYPKMPPDDREDIHLRISAGRGGLVGKLTPKDANESVRAYLWDRHTSFRYKQLMPLTAPPGLRKALARARDKIEGILASWRGEDSSGGGPSKNGSGS